MKHNQFVVPIEPEIVPLQSSSSSIQPQSLQHDQSSTPDESVGSTPSGSHTPPVQRWVRSFDNLISDHDGVNSFKRFLSEENANPNTVDFYFLCKSVPLPENDTDRPQLVRAIYRNYLLHSSKNTILPFLSKEVKDELMTEYVKIQQHKQQDPTNQSSPIEPPNYTEVFKRAQDEIYNIMSGAFYQNFLRSRTYMEKFTNEQFDAFDDPKPVNYAEKKSAERTPSPFRGMESPLEALKIDDCPIDGDLFGSTNGPNNTNYGSFDAALALLNGYRNVGNFRMPTLDEMPEHEHEISSTSSYSSNVQRETLVHDTIVQLSHRPTSQKPSSMSEREYPTIASLQRAQPKMKQSTSSGGSNWINPLWSQKSVPQYSDDGISYERSEDVPAMINQKRLGPYLRSKHLMTAGQPLPHPYYTISYSTVIPNSKCESEIQSISSNESYHQIALNNQMCNNNGTIKSTLSYNNRNDQMQQQRPMSSNNSSNQASSRRTQQRTTNKIDPTKIDPTKIDPTKNVNKFAELLIEKLKHVADVYKTDQRFYQMMVEADSDSGSDHVTQRRMGIQRLKKTMMREECGQLDREADCQSILDRHCDQVFDSESMQSNRSRRTVGSTNGQVRNRQTRPARH
ncbi:Axin-1 [Blomia tropicalis]|nr:Axin-1 [Blomia tropicalis]